MRLIRYVEVSFADCVGRNRAKHTHYNLCRPILIQALLSLSAKPVDDSRDRMELLLEMDNVIFFSQVDNPPFPNRLSGGDLDGDKFELLTKACGFWGKDYKTSAFDDYTDLAQRESEDLDPSYSIPELDFGDFNFHGSMTLPRQKIGRKPFDINEVARFIGDYVRNDCFADLEDLLMCLADQADCYERQTCQGTSTVVVKGS